MSRVTVGRAHLAEPGALYAPQKSSRASRRSSDRRSLDGPAARNVPFRFGSENVFPGPAGHPTRPFPFETPVGSKGRTCGR